MTGFTRRGYSLVELLIASAVLAILMSSVAWLGNNATNHRMKAERKLKNLTELQQVMFWIENDLMSARRHTLGNFLCNNIPFDFNGKRLTSSDPGFDFDVPRITNDPANFQAWYTRAISIVPVLGGLNAGYSVAHVTRSPRQRLFGAGSFVIESSRPGGGPPDEVRSPVINTLYNVNYERDFVLAGWVKGDTDGTAGLSPQIVIQGSNSSELSTPPLSQVPIQNLANWTYVAVRVPANFVLAGLSYTVLLRATTSGTPTKGLVASFDCVTLTSTGTIADIDYAVSSLSAPLNPVDLNNRLDLGMVFYTTDGNSGNPKEMKYIYQNDDGTFPAARDTLLRIRSSIPYIDPWNGLQWTLDWDADPASPPPPIQSLAPLPNIRHLKVEWVNDTGTSWQNGSNRPIRVTVTVADPQNPANTLSLARTLFPPTD